MTEFFRIIVFGVLGTLLIFIGKDDMVIMYLKNAGVLDSRLDTKALRFICFLIGILISGFWIPFQYAILKKKSTNDDILLKGLLEESKRKYFKIIKAELKAGNVDFNTRIFKPQKGFVGWWNKYVKKKTVLYLCTIDGISDNFHHKTLQFDVTASNIQGMVGKSFIEKALCIDFELDINSYNLTKAQRVKIGNLQFCSVIPIFSNNNQKKILALLAVDSESKLIFSSEEKDKWEKHMIYYAAFVDKHSNL